mmetsp:Transcript_71076/g.164322  ORF Transcript_71076/g.164322 Transcript_71076/m.164322 type:complete len:85 (+) Transcript_71076:584-838(+)
MLIKRFRTKGKIPGLTQAQFSGSNGMSKPPVMRAKEAINAPIEAAAAMSKHASLFGTADILDEAAPNVPIAGDGSKRGGLNCTP